MCPTVYPYSIQLKERFIMPDKEVKTIQELIFYQSSPKARCAAKAI